MWWGMRTHTHTHFLQNLWRLALGRVAKRHTQHCLSEQSRGDNPSSLDAEENQLKGNLESYTYATKPVLTS